MASHYFWIFQISGWIFLIMGLMLMIPKNSHFTKSVTIESHPGEVYSMLSSVASWKEWYLRGQASEYFHFYQTKTYEITQSKMNEKIVFQSKNLPKKIKGQFALSFKEAKETTPEKSAGKQVEKPVQLEAFFEIESNTPSWRRFGERVKLSHFKKEVHSSLVNLKSILEKGHSESEAKNS